MTNTKNTPPEQNGKTVQANLDGKTVEVKVPEDFDSINDGTDRAMGDDEREFPEGALGKLEPKQGAGGDEESLEDIIDGGIKKAAQAEPGLIVDNRTAHDGQLPASAKDEIEKAMRLDGWPGDSRSASK